MKGKWCFILSDEKYSQLFLKRIYILNDIILS